MAHCRKLVLSGVALTNARIPERRMAVAINRVRDELEQEIIQSGFLEEAPFKWIGLIIREGLVDESSPHYEKVNPKHGDLPLAIEININGLVSASENEMATAYRKATLKALIHAGERYSLPTDHLKTLLRVL